MKLNSTRSFRDLQRESENEMAEFPAERQKGQAVSHLPFTGSRHMQVEMSPILRYEIFSGRKAFWLFNQSNSSVLLVCGVRASVCDCKYKDMCPVWMKNMGYGEERGGRCRQTHEIVCRQFSVLRTSVTVCHNKHGAVFPPLPPVTDYRRRLIESLSPSETKRDCLGINREQEPLWKAYRAYRRQ